MGNRRVGSDDQVQVPHDRGGVHESSVSIVDFMADFMTWIENQRPRWPALQLRSSLPLMQIHQLHAGNCRQGGEVTQRDVAAAKHTRACSSAPVDSDAKAADRDKLGLPVDN